MRTRTHFMWFALSRASHRQQQKANYQINLHAHKTTAFKDPVATTKKFVPLTKHLIDFRITKSGKMFFFTTVHIKKL